MNSPQASTQSRPGVQYRSAAVTAAAVVLALGLINGIGPFTGPQGAVAQPASEQSGLGNALEQRKQIIAELRSLNAKIDRLDQRLTQGINVKVTSMPAQPKAEPERRPRQEQPAPAEPAPQPADQPK